ncbi:stemmadenine O-acetyltransferase-like [Mercurialis annua]|uniref:stemmadenine O-acetyltransferase-like n=1 Tax=Mercurialis annua TaxID=3986 RepID=UPI0024ACA84A|nr:stemmadenine O-acetyltransferase-like [Mercurialis annua]
MAMNIVKIISKEIIKPSPSPTPTQLRTYKLCLLDQLSAPMYAPVLLFYSPTISTIHSNISDHLKSSLSKTLTHYFPFAGRFKDALSVDCNDHGVNFTEANVDTDMSSVLNQTDADFLVQLLPCNPHDKSRNLVDQEMLLVRVNFFSCGGIAIGVCIWHALADASALASFVTSWAAIARGGGAVLENVDMDGVVVDCTSLFPPQDLLAFSTGDYLDKNLLLPRIVTKRFVFDGSKLSSLREKIGDRPTRVEALSALIWGAIITISQEKNDGPSPIPYICVNMVNLRQRMNPPLPKKCIGNINQFTMAQWPTNTEIDYKGLTKKLRQSIRKINDEYVRNMHEGGEYLKSAKSGVVEGGMKMIFSFTSWCKFPFYEADFGWGKPAWIGTHMGLNNSAVFIDAKDGEGIEAWVTLTIEDMLKFQQNHAILQYASFQPYKI